MPVLPPIEASTIPSNDVGIFTKSIPLIYVDAIKPPKSVIIPPPRFIINEFLLKPFSVKNCQIILDDSRFLFFSPDSIE